MTITREQAAEACEREAERYRTYDVDGNGRHYRRAIAERARVMDAAVAYLRQAERMREALKPLAAMAEHFPTTGVYSGRPRRGAIYAVSSQGKPDAEITVEHLRAAAAILAEDPAP